MSEDADGSGEVHCTILRIAREGKEREFEDALKRFVSRSMSHEATTGAHLIRPSAASRPREYGILRSFRNREAMNRFYESAIFTDWMNEVEDLVEGEPIYRPLHGLEAFFRDGGVKSSPPRWKMAIVTWLGVFPVVLMWSRLLPPFLEPLHPVAVTAVVTGTAVVTLTWFVMPALTRFLGSWLQSNDDPSIDD